MGDHWVSEGLCQLISNWEEYLFNIFKDFLKRNKGTGKTPGTMSLPMYTSRRHGQSCYRLVLYSLCYVFIAAYHYHPEIIPLYVTISLYIIHT